MGSLNVSDGGADLRELLAQLSTGWEQPYRDAATGTEHQMSGVYLVARGRLRRSLGNAYMRKTGRWLHFIDADQLAVAEHASTVSVSTAERQQVITMALLEVYSMPAPRYGSAGRGFDG